MIRNETRERLEAKRWTISAWLLTLDEPALDRIDAAVMREVAEAQERRDRLACEAADEQMARVDGGLAELADATPTNRWPENVDFSGEAP